MRLSVSRNLFFIKRSLSEGKTLQSSFLRSVKPSSSTTPQPSSLSSSSLYEQQTKNKIYEHPVAFSSNKAASGINLNSSKNDRNTMVPDDIPESIPETSSGYQTHEPNFVTFSPVIKVIGVGGGGCNAVNNMIQRELVGVDFICANTDVQHLSRTYTENRIQLGRRLTSGLGCGANPNQGRDAAEESREEIKEAIAGAQMVFITAGMGGGTGTGAAPVVASICQELGVLTVAVVTTPFNFEGKQRSRFALEGIRALYDRVDTIIVIPNENLRKIDNGSTKMQDAFSLSNDVLLAGVKNITDLMTKPGLINLDFADVRTIMSGMGNAIMGTGQCTGPDRAKSAARNALNNPLLGSDSNVIRSAKGVLVNITGGSDISIEEAEDAINTITSEIVDEDANIIFGASIDPSLDGSIRVSVVATGIDMPNNFLLKK